MAAEAAAARFLASVFVDGGDAYWSFPGAFRPDGTYAVARGALAAAYRASAAGGRAGSRAALAAVRAVDGVTTARRSVVFDVPRVCAALGAAPCADVDRSRP